jgi:hypothetical protein
MNNDDWIIMIWDFPTDKIYHKFVKEKDVEEETKIFFKQLSGDKQTPALLTWLDKKDPMGYKAVGYSIRRFKVDSLDISKYIVNTEGDEWIEN